jgi:hypothetical protein
MSQLSYKPYTSEYKSALLKIFKSNCSKYFDPGDESDLIDYLDNYTDENYLVVFKDDEIIGCGGHYTKGSNHRIAWVMFAKGSLGHRGLLSISDEFYQHLESKIKDEGLFYPIQLNTTQLMENMFNRYGFKTYQIIKDGFGDGLDEYKMEKVLRF